MGTTLKKDICTVGRKTKLTKSVVKKVIKFYQEYQETETTHIEEEQNKDGATKSKLKITATGLPSLTKLADAMNIPRMTMYHWNQNYPEFRNLINNLSMSLSKDIVINNALLGHFNPQFAKSLLENEYNWNKDSHESTDKPATIIFKTQINHFLAQQGVEPIKISGKDALPSFTEPEDIS